MESPFVWFDLRTTTMIFPKPERAEDSQCRKHREDDDKQVDDVVLHEGRPIHSDGPSGHELGCEDEPQRPFDDAHHVCPNRSEREKDRDEEQEEGCDDDTEHRPSRLPLERLESTWLPAEPQEPVLDYLLVSHALTP